MSIKVVVKIEIDAHTEYDANEKLDAIMQVAGAVVSYEIVEGISEQNQWLNSNC